MTPLPLAGRRRNLLTALLLTVLVAPLLALAQGSYPDKPVRVGVPSPPGGGTS